MTAYVPALTETNLNKIVLSIQQLAAGRSNSTGTVTLATGAASTVVFDQNCAAGTTPILSPATAAASAENAAGTIHISAVANGSFTITHVNSATTGRTYRYALHG